MNEQELREKIQVVIEEGIADRVKAGLLRHRGKLIGGVLGAGLGGAIALGSNAGATKKGIAIGAAAGAGLGALAGAKRVRKIFGQIFSVIGQGLVIMAEQETLRRQEVIDNFKFAMKPYDDIKQAITYLPQSAFTVQGSMYLEKVYMRMMNAKKTFDRVNPNDYEDIMSFYAYSQQQLKEIEELLEKAQKEIEQ